MPGYDVYLGRNTVVTTRDRLSDDPTPLFPRPNLPSQSPSQALTRRGSSRRSSRSEYGVLPSQMSTSAPAQLEERSPRRSHRYEVPAPAVIHQQPAASRYEVPAPPMIPAPQWQQPSRLVLPAPIPEPVLEEAVYYNVPGPAPEVPEIQRHSHHRRHRSQPEAQHQAPTSSPSRSLRVDIPQHQQRVSGHRRAPSSASSLSPGTVSSAHSSRSGASHSGRSSGGGTPDTSRSRVSRDKRRDKSHRLLEEPSSGPRPWSEEVVVRDAIGRKVRRYHFE